MEGEGHDILLLLLFLVYFVQVRRWVYFDRILCRLFRGDINTHERDRTRAVPSQEPS